MQKKMVGILASVAAAHAVLAIALMTGGGCRQTKILAPHTYNNGPQVAEVPAAVNDPEKQKEEATLPNVKDGEAKLPPAIEEDMKDKQPVTPPPVPVAGGTKTYKVKKGDSLSMIAYKHGVRTRDLAACNNLTGKAANNIRIGQVLTIPEGGVYNESRTPKKNIKKNVVKPRSGKKKPAPKASLPADGIYVVKSGDSLDRIGRRFGVSAKAIAKENNIALTKILQIGDKLRIPGKAAAKPVDTATDTTTPADNNVPNVNNTNILDGIDPSSGLDTTAAPADNTAVPADNNNTTLSTDNIPSATTESATISVEVPSDMSLATFCELNKVSVETIRSLNINIPSDDQLKANTYLIIPAPKK